ncbi:hypothetical protein HHI36_019887 [Cryptolaemus montrouzieri]|uniref:Uncharacterized protein n=1 Tax=Cryptolaemus montrouzieri TaxID=559131 RepID=A0ABD2N8I8_9CUCU
MNNPQDSTMEIDDAALAGPSSINQQNYTISDYVLVKFLVRNTKYCSAAVINKIDTNEGELTVTFVKICDDKGYTFRIVENDVSDMCFNQPIVNQNTENCNNKQSFHNCEIAVVPEVASINSESKFKVVSHKKKRKPELLGNQKHSSLKAVAKLASVNISRIDPSSTAESIENHLQENGIDQYQVEIGFSKHPDVYKSFIVTTPQDVLDEVKQPDLCPEGASVSNFLYRLMKIKEMQK